MNGYEYGAMTSGSDANWLAGEVDLTVDSSGEFRATQRLALRTVALEQFRDQLRVLDRELTGEARFEHLESRSA